ncbi:DUF2459 domain-containing protein [Brevundimonas naejangsanensis]|uniref:DUF2459 domain-containing protein n=1 Tax=Brevundimonas naejangsanensis TaxID=588932 RepID=UPI0013C4DE18|nr:DUF2459 domain-containing protein [Brevundimonas naejangsanensis]
MAIRLLVAALIGLLGGLWTATWAGDPALFPAAPGDDAVVVHLLDNGYHTELVVPRAALARGADALAGAVRGLPPGDWVAVGWGDAVFYVAEGPVRDRLGDGARALFRPGGNPSILMLAPIDFDPTATPSARRVSLRLSKAGFAALRARVAASLALDAAGRAVPAAGRPGAAAGFFRSGETFWIGHVCNHWTAQALNAAGLPMPIAPSVWSGVVLEAARRAAEGGVGAGAAGLGRAGRLDPAPSRSRAGVRSPAARDGGAPWPASNTPATPAVPWGRRSASSAPAS